MKQLRIILCRKLNGNACKHFMFNLVTEKKHVVYFHNILLYEQCLQYTVCGIFTEDGGQVSISVLDPSSRPLTFCHTVGLRKSTLQQSYVFVREVQMNLYYFVRNSFIM